MPETTVEILVENRLLSTKELLKGLNDRIITNTIEEVKAIYGFEDKTDGDLSMLEQSYLADLSAAVLLKYSLDRYKEDAKAKLGPDSLVHESQDKLKFLKEMIDRLEKDAEMKRGKLGLDAVSIPALVTKIPAASEDT
jgi:hypothetical protein